MRQVAVALVLALAFVSLAAAQSLDAFDPAVGRWVDQRVRAARRGEADLVELPLAVASLGWGCSCPDTYLGTSPDTEGAAWLDVVTAPGVTLPQAGTRGAVMMVRGYFTGGFSRFEGDADQMYVQHRFVVTEVTRRRAPESPRVRIVTAGAYACTSVVSDDTPLNVRARPGARAEVVGELANGTAVTIDEVRPDWLHLTAPIAGWVYSENVATTCTPAASPAPAPTE